MKRFRFCNFMMTKIISFTLALLCVSILPLAQLSAEEPHHETRHPAQPGVGFGFSGAQMFIDSDYEFIFLRLLNEAVQNTPQQINISFAYSVGTPYFTCAEQHLDSMYSIFYNYMQDRVLIVVNVDDFANNVYTTILFDENNAALSAIDFDKIESLLVADYVSHEQRIAAGVRGLITEIYGCYEGLIRDLIERETYMIEALGLNDDPDHPIHAQLVRTIEILEELLNGNDTGARTLETFHKVILGVTCVVIALVVVFMQKRKGKHKDIS